MERFVAVLGYLALAAAAGIVCVYVLSSVIGNARMVAADGGDVGFLLAVGTPVVIAVLVLLFRD
jgi:hypothetical protein